MTPHEAHAKIFKAFCDPKRLAILEQLRSGEKCACKLADPAGLSQSGLSYHMKILVEAGIVSAREEGVWTHYRLNPEGQAKALELLETITTPDADAAPSCCDS